MNQNSCLNTSRVGRDIFYAAIFCVSVFPSLLWAQDTKKTPSSKLYVVNIDGDAQMDTGEKIEPLTEKSVFSAQGTTLVTKADASGVLVFSNGTGVHLSPDTRFKVNSFIQEPFTPNRTDMDVEPSISRTHITLTRGNMGVCTNKLVAGSSMLYQTGFALISIRGAKVAIEAEDEETRISVLDGEVTVRGGPQDLAGQVVTSGQTAIVRPGQPGQPNTVAVSGIPDAVKGTLAKNISAACMGKRTVYFDVREGGSGDESTAGNPGGGGGIGQVIVPIEVIGGDIKPGSEISPARIPE